MGFCVFGLIGDCSNNIKDVIKSFNETVNSSMSSSLQSISSSNSNIVSGTQTINIGNIKCGGPINISGITQTMIARINFQALSQSIDKNTFHKMIHNAVKQGAQAAAKTAQHFMSSGTSTSVDQTTQNEQINQISNSYSFSDFTKDLQSVKTEQNLGIMDLTSMPGMACNISNITQYMYLDVLASMVSKHLTSALQKIASNSVTTQTTAAKTAAKSAGPISDITGGISKVTTGIFGNISKTVEYVIIGVIAAVVLAFVAFLAFHMLRKPKKPAPQTGKGLRWATSSRARPWGIGAK
ncbi:MAG: hypothetical protein ACYCOU_11035 [Sulfobacillus sp.]